VGLSDGEPPSGGFLRFREEDEEGGYCLRLPQCDELLDKPADLRRERFLIAAGAARCEPSLAEPWGLRHIALPGQAGVDSQ
jgi:hypothetical protein